MEEMAYLSDRASRELKFKAFEIEILLSEGGGRRGGLRNSDGDFWEEMGAGVETKWNRRTLIMRKNVGLGPSRMSYNSV